MHNFSLCEGHILVANSLVMLVIVSLRENLGAHGTRDVPSFVVSIFFRETCARNDISPEVRTYAIFSFITTVDLIYENQAHTGTLIFVITEVEYTP